MESRLARALWVATFALVLTACGDEDADSQAAAAVPSGANHAPVISGKAATTVVEGDLYDFTPEASDPDGDPLIFHVSGKPGWMDFDSQSGRLSGRPRGDDVGKHRGIVVSVSDGSDETLLDPLDVDVLPATSVSNQPPTISGTPANTATTGVFYDFIPTVSDPDGDTLTYSIVNRPVWASFNSTTGRLSGTPTAAHVGTYSGISIRVSDGELTAALSFDVEVVGVNFTPVIGGSPPAAVVVGSIYSFTPQASDADGDQLSFSAANLPVWASFNASTGSLSGNPGTGDVGVYANISITVSDGLASAVLGPFSIEVMAVASGTATLTWTPPTENTDGTPLTDLAGYIVYWGTQSGNYSSSVTLDGAGLTSYVVENLLPGTTYFFATTAFNGSGIESSFSNEASKAIQ